MSRTPTTFLLAVLVVLFSSSARAITVDLYVESSLPSHTYVSDDEDLGEFATTDWGIAPVDFPALAGETGVLTIRFNAPLGQQFISTEPITELQFIVEWRNANAGRPGLVFETMPVFANSSIPGSLNWSNVVFRSPFPNDAPNDLIWVVMSTSLGDIPAGFRFSSLEVSVPIDEVLKRFPLAGELPLRQSCFCSIIIGDVPISARHDPYIVLAPIPEPSSSQIAFIGGVGAATMHLLRRYRPVSQAMRR